MLQEEDLVDRSVGNEEMGTTATHQSWSNHRSIGYAGAPGTTAKKVTITSSARNVTTR